MMICRPASLSLLLAFLLLAGCAGRPPTPSAPRGADQAPGRGIYKVGTPYQIGGVWYRPAEDFAYDETGIASWYGEDFHGKYTANGEIYDLNALTAAHRTLPMPSIVQVTNLENGRTLDLRVNDRGPYARGRIIDVSRRAAQLLGFEAQGTAKVRVKILVPESIQVASLARGNTVEAKAADEAPRAAPREAVLAEDLSPTPGLRVASTEAAPLSRPAAIPAAQPAAPPPLSDNFTIVPVKATQIYIQAGAYAVADNAFRVKARLDPLGPVKVYGARVNGINVYRVRVGPIDTVDQADKLLGRVVDSGLPEAQLVVD